MHPDQNKINQIVVKATTKGQIATCMAELTGLVQKDIKGVCATKGAKSPECQEYFQELQTCLNSCLGKVSDPAVKTELKSQFSSFIAAQQKGGSDMHF